MLGPLSPAGTERAVGSSRPLACSPTKRPQPSRLDAVSREGRLHLCSLPHRGGTPLAILAAVGVMVSGCGEEAPNRNVDRIASSGPSLTQVVFAETLLFVTDDHAEPGLAVPNWISESSEGVFAISDGSDQDIKLYDGLGDRVGTVGRVGQGPGEFDNLKVATFFRDSLFGYDVGRDRLSVFDAAGNFVRAATIAKAPATSPWLLRPVDDSLFLAVATLHSGVFRDLLALLQPSGSCCLSAMLDRERYLGRDPYLLQWTSIEGDARGGYIYGAVDDSLFAFSYEGERVAGERLPTELMPISVKETLRRNDGRPQRPDGSWIFHGHVRPLEVLALDGGRVALQFHRYDSNVGVDRVEGGAIGLMALDGKGGFALLGVHGASGALLGRDFQGRPLIVGYAEATESYAVSVLEFTPPPDRASGGLAR